MWAHNTCTAADVQKEVKAVRPRSRLGTANAQRVADQVNAGNADGAKAILQDKVKGVGPVRSQKIVDALAPSKPTEAYNRQKHYGKTPTAADRKAVGAGSGQVADHDPPLVKRYYEGDPARGEKPGYQMTPAERKASGADRSRMTPQPADDSNAQGGQMSQYSKQQKTKYGL